ncbi:MAG: ATP-binding cassette domain-containing protein, partial [Pseudomonadota bacterium]
MSEVLRVSGIRKAYPGVVANDDVGFAVAAGEVHALLGENGAGKSTLIKIMTGLYQPDAGAVLVDGAPVRFRSTQAAQAAGVAAVYQEP